MLQPSTLKFLKDLSKNNNKPWFDAHRKQYEDAKKDFETFIQVVIDKHGLKDETIREQEAKKCLFRINRDVRFSKDKRPYKTHIAGLIPFDGNNPMEGPAALYFHLGTEEFVGFGFYRLETPSLLKLRKKLLDEKEGPKLAALVEATRKKGFIIDAMEKLKRPPPGVAKDHPRVELLKHKALAVGRDEIPKSVRYSAKLKPWLVEQAEIAAPVVKWGLKEKL